jgi:hypothetical protein
VTRRLGSVGRTCRQSDATADQQDARDQRWTDGLAESHGRSTAGTAMSGQSDRAEEPLRGAELPPAFTRAHPDREPLRPWTAPADAVNATSLDGFCT